MNELQIEILLLGVISFSLTFLAYIAYSEYKRYKHIGFLKRIIIMNDDMANDLLASKKREQNRENSLFGKIKIFMQQAGISLPLWLFISIFLLLCGVSGFAFALFLEHWSGLIIGGFVGVLIQYLSLQSFENRRKKEFNRALAIAISVLVKMMKNGIGFEQALLKSISVSNSKILKSIFANFFQEKNTIGEAEAFKHLSRYVVSKELLIFALAIKIGRESGGQFSNTLEKVEKTITYRKKMQEKVDVVTREGSVGSYIVVGIAIFLYFMINGNFDGKIHTYFMESEYGRFQLLGIGLWIFIGMLANKFITKVEK